MKHKLTKREKLIQREYHLKKNIVKIQEKLKRTEESLKREEERLKKQNERQKRKKKKNLEGFGRYLHQYGSYVQDPGTVSKDQLYFCYGCKLEFPSEIHLRFHLSRHVSRVYEPKINLPNIQPSSVETEIPDDLNDVNQEVDHNICENNKDQQTFCHTCKKKFFNNTNLLHHIKMHISQPSVVISRVEGYKENQNVCPPDIDENNEDRQYLCNGCKQQFENETDLLLHFREEHISFDASKSKEHKKKLLYIKLLEYVTLKYGNTPSNLNNKPKKAYNNTVNIRLEQSDNSKEKETNINVGDLSIFSEIKEEIKTEETTLNFEHYTDQNNECQQFFCYKCKEQFLDYAIFLQHIKTHISQPSVVLFRIDEYQENLPDMKIQNNEHEIDQSITKIDLEECNYIKEEEIDIDESSFCL